MIDHVAVVVPAHNEEAEILGCLTALVAAVEAASSLSSVQVIAVADRCADGTAGLIERFAARHPVVTPMTVPFGNVGRARDAGAQAALDAIAAVDADEAVLERTWLVFTDADTRVPENWITAHLDHAGQGADCVVGTVEPRADVGNDDLIEAWFAAHHLGEGHDHVFGANLGIRGSHFVRIGGCPPLRLGEDVAMVHAVTAVGGTIRRTDDCRVVTSARMLGRCHGGFSTYLRELADETDGRLGDIDAEKSHAG